MCKRYYELKQKEMILGLTPEESDELLELEEEYEREMSEAERVGMTQTQWGWM